MGVNIGFQLYKVSRFLKVYGESFSFKRYKLNDFKEPIDNEFDTITICGFYHEQSAHVTESAADASVTRSKPQPMILCMPDDGAKVKNGDVLEYKGSRYKVVEPANPGKIDACTDISLAVIQDG